MKTAPSRSRLVRRSLMLWVTAAVVVLLLAYLLAALLRPEWF